MEAKYPCLAIAKDANLHFYHIENIVYFKSDGNNSVIFNLKGEAISTNKKFKELEYLIPKDVFVRVHHSYIINLLHVTRYSTEEGLIYLGDGTSIPVSRRKKADLLAKFIKL